jgi:ribosomal protein RSM22 (predicted rRNA methylase)
VTKVLFLILSVGIDSSSLSAEQQEELKFRFKKQVIKRLKQTLHCWRPVEYDEHKALLYMVARFAPEYTVLHRIFMELKTREPDFQPHSLFDFGSGVGTATW